MFFGLLIGIVIIYFIWQIQQAKRLFINHVQNHARLVAAVVRLHAKSAVLSQIVIEQILSTFMEDTARFAAYLDNVEPFNSDELTAFAQEAGLAGIRIIRRNGKITEGPPGWVPDNCPSCTKRPSLVHLKNAHEYLYIFPKKESQGCVIVGIAAQNIEELQKEIGLRKVLSTLSNLPGIAFCKLSPLMPGENVPSNTPEVILNDLSKCPTAIAKVKLNNQEVLVVGIEAEDLARLVTRLWKEFFGLTILLAIVGGGLSYILYKQQTSHLAQIQQYERELYRQQQDAALGRSAAAIAHEIRNPLNAIAMGLQRLKLELSNLDQEHIKLIDYVLDAVRRADTTVNELLRYARPRKPKIKEVLLDQIIDSIISLYKNKCEELGIKLKIQLNKTPIWADPDLIGQVVENLIKNAIEAQESGGFINIRVFKNHNYGILEIENSGLNLSEDQLKHIFEPYFTTKTRGTGLGLAVSDRIIRAHNGKISARKIGTDIILIKVELPLVRGGKKKA